jgi:hypothetical protein
VKKSKQDKLKHVPTNAGKPLAVVAHALACASSDFFTGSQGAVAFSTLSLKSI